MYPRRFHTRAWGRILIVSATALLWEGFASAQERSDRSYFVDRDGIPTLTNHPDRYRSRAGFREIKMAQGPRVQFARSLEPEVLRFRPYKAEYLVYIRRYAEKFGVDENIILSIMRHESNFNFKARSRAGACGLMQLMPATAAELKVTDIFDPEQNIAGGTEYFAKMLKRFDGDLELALAAYNAGPGAVHRYDGVPPFVHTRVYVKRVQQFARKLTTGAVKVAPVESSASAKKILTPKRAETSPPVIPEKRPATVYFTNGVVMIAQNVRIDGYNYYIELEKRTLTIPRSHIRRIAVDARPNVEPQPMKAVSH